MKVKINKIEFHKEFETKFGTMYSFKVQYDDKTGFYTSKKKEQNTFEAGKEYEVLEEKKTYTDKNGEQRPYYTIKPLMQKRQSGFGKALGKEQARYSGFAVSYAKDLVVAGKIERDELSPFAWVLFELMVEMDKSLEA